MGFKALITKGADPRKANKYGTTVLSLLVKRGQMEMMNFAVEELKMSREDQAKFVNVESTSGWTPLMAASEVRDNYNDEILTSLTDSLLFFTGRQNWGRQMVGRAGRQSQLSNEIFRLDGHARSI